MQIYEHTKHGHKPRDVNEVVKYDQVNNFNAKLAVALTKTVGSMYTAYTFVGLAFVGLLSILGFFSPTISLLTSWLSQTLIQLVLLPVIMVGQNVLGRHQELQSEETYLTTQKIYKDIENITNHLHMQDTQISKLTTLIEQSLKKDS